MAKQKKDTKEETSIKLNMDFEAAMKKALNTPLPVKKAPKKKGK